MFEKEKKRRKVSGCFRNSLPSLFIIVVVIIIAITTMVSHCDLSILSKYKKVLDELQIKVTEQEMAPNAIKADDYDALKADINAFIENNNDDVIFDENNALIYDNILPENITYKDNTLTLNKRTLACFINSAIMAGWGEGFYDKENNIQLLKILEISTLKTTDGTTTITAVGKIDVNSVKKYTDSSSVAEIVDSINGEIYLTYTATFNTEVLSSEMRVNKLSDESNDRLLSLVVVGLEGDPDKVILNQKLNSIMESVLSELQKFCDFWGLDYSFEDEYLVLSTR